jgi:hypothetical protein
VAKSGKNKSSISGKRPTKQAVEIAEVGRATGLTMNKSRIKNMPAGKEIDGLVAEIVFGESKPVYIHIHGNVFSAQWSNGKNWYCTQDYFNGDVCEWTPKEFSKNISAAQEVINVIAKEPFAWHFESINTETGVKWRARLLGDMPDGSIAEYSAEADTISLAISRAALLKCGGG